MVGRIQVLRDAGVEVGDRAVVAEPAGDLCGDACVRRLGRSSRHVTDFGTDGVIDRFAIEPTVLLSVPDYAYNGKRHIAGRLEIVSALPSLRASIVVEPGGSARSSRHRSRSCRCFDHPWYVLFSSGTTGKPKFLVHRTGGAAEHLTEHVSIPTSAPATRSSTSTAG